MINTNNAVVTGSASSLGLGIAKAFTVKGVRVMLNGFGDPDEIEGIRKGLEAEYGVKVIHSGADISEPTAIRSMIPDTAKARSITEEEILRDALLAPQPTKRFIEIDEVAALAVFLSSDQAASITGTSLCVDGGWTAQ